jgi:hypothetical protein
MLGEQISEGQGKRTGRRVVATDPHLKVEVSFEETTKLLGADGLNIGTYISYPKPGGSLHGEGEGVFASLDGEMAAWRAIGVGQFGPDGSVRYRGTLSFNTLSQKLIRLNSMAGMFEFDVDAQGNTRSKIWGGK